MNSIDQFFLGKFCVKVSTSLIGLEKFGKCRKCFSLCGIRGYTLISQKMTKSPVIGTTSASHQIFTSPCSRSLSPLLVLEIEHYSLNTSFDLKFLSNRMSQFFQGILKKFLPVMHIFTRIDNLWPWKSAAGRKLLVPPLKFWKSSPPP